jgi:hypothetical protein
VGKVGPFDIVNALYKGTNLYTDPDTPKEELEKAYVPFLINRALSYNIGTLFFADDLNFYHGLDHRMQHDYLNNSIKPGKRNYSSWSKPDTTDDVLMLSEYYGYSLTKAREALPLLSENDLEDIREKMKKGGQESVGKG